METYHMNRSEPGNNRLQNTMNWIIDITLAVVLAVFLVQNLGTLIQIEGSSMEPVLESGDSILADKIRYHFIAPKRLDLVAFQNEEASSKVYVKRVVGLPGETVQIKDGVLYINEQEQNLKNSGYISLPGLAGEPVKLKENEYFLLGDNMESSEDSRFSNIGNVGRNQLIGKVWFRIEPLEKFGFLK